MFDSVVAMHTALCDVPVVSAARRGRWPASHRDRGNVIKGERSRSFSGVAATRGSIRSEPEAGMDGMSGRERSANRGSFFHL